MNAVAEHRQNDDIDLFDLVDDIKDKWQLAVVTTGVVTLLALVYAFLATPTFQSQLVFKPVSEAELLQLNQPKLQEVLGVTEGKSYLTPEQAFKNVRSMGLSTTYIRQFYQQQLESADAELKALIYNSDISPEQNVAKFSELLSHQDQAAKSTDVFLTLKFELSNPELSARVLNFYGAYVQERHMAEMQSAISMRIQAQLEKWRGEAEELRASYLGEKSRRLLELQEAAEVAASIDQQLPMYRADRVAVGFEPPLYMMGEKALRAEITQLKARSSKGEDQYIEGLAELLWKIKTVEEAFIDWSVVRFVQLDQDAVVPLSPIKPKKKLVVASGFVAGGMVGILFALLAAAQDRRRQRKALQLQSA